MATTRSIIVVGLAALVTACGVPEQKYKAALAEQEQAMQATRAEREKVLALERRAADLQASLDRLTQSSSALEKEKAAALATAEQQRALAGQLEADKAAAASEAERQRLLAARLEQEKSDLQKKSGDYQSLASTLEQEIKAGRIQLSELQGKLTVRMAEKVLFPSGSDAISRDGKRVLAKVAEALQEVKGRIIRVEGHTDNVPIHTERFPSNWELSAARAIAVVRFLQAQGVDPGLLGAAGYGEYQPIGSNLSAEGRAQNRRIEISLAAPPSALPQSGPVTSPAAVPPQ